MTGGSLTNVAIQAAMTNPSDALGGQSLYEKYGAKYQDVIDAITKVGEAY